MASKKITFEEIQTSDLLYYDTGDRELAKSSFEFCQKRDIDVLPSLTDPKAFYSKADNGFCEEVVTPERMVGRDDFIFDPSLLDRFRKNHLLFVYANHEITGVVHFSDYNRPAVDAYLFDLLSDYERSLRKLLIYKGLKNQDMLDYFQFRGTTTNEKGTKHFYTQKISTFEKKRALFENRPVFESFYLKDLIELIEYRLNIKLWQGVNDLRNNVMHSHELVNRLDVTREDYIYDFKTFEDFFKKVEALLQDRKRVNNKIAFIHLMEA